MALRRARPFALFGIAALAACGQEAPTPPRDGADRFEVYLGATFWWSQRATPRLNDSPGRPARTNVATPAGVTMGEASHSPNDGGYRTLPSLTTTKISRSGVSFGVALP